MAKQRTFEEGKEGIKAEEANPVEKLEEIADKTPPMKKVKTAEKPIEAPVLISFDRWFAAKGFKPHWKQGMMAFTDTTMRKTFEEWEAIFKKY